MNSMVIFNSYVNVLGQSTGFIVGEHNSKVTMVGDISNEFSWAYKPFITGGILDGFLNSN